MTDSQTILKLIETVDPSDETMEIWKPVNGFEGFYEISNQGRVKSLERIILDKLGRNQKVKERFMKPNIIQGKYLIARLSRNYTVQPRQVHRLVAEHFIGKSDLQVNHKDRNPKNNHVSNLEYVTPRENVRHFREGKRDLPFGVIMRNGRYRAKACINGVEKSLGTFDTISQANNAVIEAIEYERSKS